MPRHTLAQEPPLPESARDAIYRDTFEQAAIGIAHVGLDGQLLRVNRKLCDILGRSAQELFAFTVRELSHPADIDAARPHLDRLLAGEIENFSVEKRYLHRDGRTLWVRLSVALVRKADGKPDYQIAMYEDVSERRLAEQALKKSEERFRHAVRGSQSGIWDWDLVSGTYYMSPRLKEMLGYADEEFPNDRASLIERVHPDDRQRIDNARVRHLAERTPYEVDYRLRRRDGSYFWCRSTGQALRDESGSVVRFAGSATDVDAHKRAEDELARLAHHDALTGLPNRHLLRDRLSQALAQGRRNDWKVGVMYVDLDGFKPVNDRYGHEFGDRVLIEAGRRLVQCTRGGDTVARLGGDEFAVVLPDMTDAHAAGMVAQKILEALAAPHEFEGRSVRIGASIGIAAFPENGTDHDSLMRNADCAMYRAKNQGSGRYQFCSPPQARDDAHPSGPAGSSAATPS